MDADLMRTRGALVTGAASGIGRSTALGLARRGCRLGLSDSNERGLHDVEREILALGAAPAPIRISIDVRRSEDHARVAETLDEWDDLSILVCCAGVLRTAPLADTSEAQWDEMFDVNVKGVFLSIRNAIPALERSAQRTGRRSAVVVVSSAAALRPKVGSGAYAATKVALLHLVRVWAVELASRGINVNAVAPGTVRTPMIAQFPEGRSGAFHLSGVSPIGRIAEPQDVADAILFLTSTQADYVTGATLSVDGGTTAAFVANPMRRT